MFLRKLLALRSEDKKRIGKIVDGAPRKTRRHKSLLSYNILYENGVRLKAGEVRDRVRSWKKNWRFCHAIEPDVSLTLHISLPSHVFYPGHCEEMARPGLRRSFEGNYNVWWGPREGLTPLARRGAYSCPYLRLHSGVGVYSLLLVVFLLIYRRFWMPLISVRVAWSEAGQYSTRHFITDTMNMLRMMFSSKWQQTSSCYKEAWSFPCKLGG